MLYLKERYERKKKRVSHTADFKAKVGFEEIRSDKTINEITQLYEIHPVQVAETLHSCNAVKA